MNVYITTGSKQANVAGIGPNAWNHGGIAVYIPAVHHPHQRDDIKRTKVAVDRETSQLRQAGQL